MVVCHSWVEAKNRCHRWKKFSIASLAGATNSRNLSKCGVGSWKFILNCHREVFEGRTEGCAVGRQALMANYSFEEPKGVPAESSTLRFHWIVVRIAT
ncbi:hypothetical protein EJ110_NYTH46350 [Nymphaea thermarum]|nr:hypothetical protein EJ110_NYTH46350 [Nymphaea thermarum]